MYGCYFSGSFIAVGIWYLSMCGYSIKDRYADVILWIILFLIAFSHQWSFMKKMNDLCLLQDDFSHLSRKSCEKSTQAVKKARLSFILTVIHVLVTSVSIVIGYWIQKFEEVTSELKTISAVIHIFIVVYWLFMASSFLPGFILCAQMSCNLMKSTEEILDSERNERTKVILRNTVRFSKRAEKTSKLLSPMYLHLSLFAFLPLTVRIYQLIDFGLIGSSPPHMLVYVGIVIDIVGNGLGTNWILNIQSEDMKQKFKDVKQKINQLVTSPLRQSHYI